MVYDVIVIGGGITGAGILRDCALRGLRALLIEKSGLGRATTAASTHLIHGGLRYLLYDRLTTHTTSWDAGNIVRIAGPMLKRLPILWPFYRGARHGSETVETLLESYDEFQRMKSGLPHLRIGPESAAELVPGLKTKGLRGAVSFDEWWVDAIGLVEKNIGAAKALGAEIRTDTEAVGLIREDGKRVVGVTVDTAGKKSELRAKVVINAAGPWADRVSRLAGIPTPLRLRKGTHLVYGKPLVPIGLLLEAVDRERHIFVIPFEKGTLVGPTDLPGTDDPDQLGADGAEIQYLLDSVRRFLPDFPKDYSSTITGARPIIDRGGSEKLLSREYEVRDHEAAGVEGFLTVAGGKMSDFRLMAKDSVDLACRKLGRTDECTTHSVTLEGESVGMMPVFRRPWRPLKRFLRRHPYLRECHALFWLGLHFAVHLLQRILGGKGEVSAERLRDHYGLSRSGALRTWK
ncbi:MAG: FAD-dependent oxidoreductase [Elusimicrobiota bacterium]